MRRFILVLVSFLAVTTSCAQDSTRKPSFTWSGVIDLYYMADFDHPDTHTRPGFLYSYNRTDEFNLNLALVEGRYDDGHVRGNLGLMAGSYAGANLAAEPDWLRHVYEANVGLHLSKRSDLWLDAGILPSHIGFETAIGKDNWNLGRSIIADNSPYYESGIRLAYRNAKSSWYFAGYVLNGWQRITRPPGNSTPAFGTQVTFTPNGRFSINSSTFIGNDKPDTARRMRYFHDLYAVAQWTDRLSTMAGFDVGMEQKSKRGSDMNTWYGFVVILRYKASERWYVSGRGEWYHDPSGVIIPAPGVDGGFRTWGGSLNVDYSPIPHVLWRLEGRLLGSKADIFGEGTHGGHSVNMCVGSALDIYF